MAGHPVDCRARRRVQCDRSCGEELAFRSGLQTYVAQITPWPDSALGRGLVAVAVSGTAFGLLHADVVAGAVAGILYGLLFLRTGRVIDAVVAHGITNFLICIVVLGFAQWSYW